MNMSNKAGWPWTANHEPPLKTMSNGHPWPKITVVTPSFNQGEFIEETILSVLHQGYPNLEYMVIDGGSTDSTGDIIARYADRLAYWVSEPDKGQAHAINKGWQRATGDILGWLNSDDLYTVDTLVNVAKIMARQANIKWICGQCRYVNRTRRPREVRQPALEDLGSWLLRFRNWQHYCFPQPSVFLRADLIGEVGLLNTILHYSFDHEYWCRVRLAGHEPLLVQEVLSEFRIHETSKTSSSDNRFLMEDLQIANDFSWNLPFVEAIRTKRLVADAMAISALWPDRGSNRARPDLTQLFRLLKTHPFSLVTRPYWGAVRRAVTTFVRQQTGRMR